MSLEVAVGIIGFTALHFSLKGAMKKSPSESRRWNCAQRSSPQFDELKKAEQEVEQLKIEYADRYDVRKYIEIDGQLMDTADAFPILLSRAKQRVADAITQLN